MKPSGFWCKGVLTLQGAQNLGKTSWFRALVPQELRHLIREGMHLDAQNRDCIVTAVFSLAGRAGRTGGDRCAATWSR